MSPICIVPYWDWACGMAEACFTPCFIAGPTALPVPLPSMAQAAWLKGTVIRGLEFGCFDSGVLLPIQLATSHRLH